MVQMKSRVCDMQWSADYFSESLDWLASEQDGMMVWEWA